MTNITARHYALALLKATDTQDSDELVANFMQLIKQNGHLNKLEQIIKEYQRLAAEKKDGVKAKLTVALTENQDKILQLVKQITIPGVDKFSVATNIDKKLLGGFILQVKDVLIDASLKKQVNNLKSALENV